MIRARNARIRERECGGKHTSYRERKGNAMPRHNLHMTNKCRYLRRFVVVKEIPSSEVQVAWLLTRRCFPLYAEFINSSQVLFSWSRSLTQSKTPRGRDSLGLPSILNFFPTQISTSSGKFSQLHSFRVLTREQRACTLLLIAPAQKLHTSRTAPNVRKAEQIRQRHLHRGIYARQETHASTHIWLLIGGVMPMYLCNSSLKCTLSSSCLLALNTNFVTAALAGSPG
jgi:hypothetical protein